MGKICLNQNINLFDKFLVFFDRIVEGFLKNFVIEFLFLEESDELFVWVDFAVLRLKCA